MRLVAVVGPTASGKTALAIELAQRLDAEIVSADSQQCYRGLDAATAKPTKAEQAQARHHLLDWADPEDQLDAAQFIERAEQGMREIAARGKRVIVAGGTGLWIRALLHGLVDAPGASAAFRAALREEFEKLGVPALHARLAESDPASAAKILPNDKVRIERALEVHALSGRPLSELQREHGFREPLHEALFINLDPPRELLAERIARRTRQLFESGALQEETSRLQERIARIPAAAKALKIIGYGECASLPPAEAEERINARTRQYARRQRTWFRKDAGSPESWPIDAARLCERVALWYEAPR